MPENPDSTTRYEQIMLDHSIRPGDAAVLFCRASRHARAVTSVDNDHQRVIRDVAAGVAAPALVGATIWMLGEARRRNLERLRFLSRDGQIFYELARRLMPRLGIDLDLEYVYSSRLTWSLAATDSSQLDSTAWLFNSFMKSNAGDLFARLGLPIDEYTRLLAECGVSLDPDVRADQDQQAHALRKFLRTSEVKAAAHQRILDIRDLLVEYAVQHQLTEPSTGLVDAGWTGRMIGALLSVCDTESSSRPHILLWGHEPRRTGWTDPHRVAAYMYNTATRKGLSLRVPDAPFVIETFCMGDHGIVSGYRRSESGAVEPVLKSPTNTGAENWGLAIYRATLYAFADAVSAPPLHDMRPLVHDLMDAFWCCPTANEAAAWGAYPYDSDPAGTAIRPLARALEDDSPTRGDRAWLAGALALSSRPVRDEFLRDANEAEIVGVPAND